MQWHLGWGDPMEGCHAGGVEEYRSIWGGRTQWKDVTWLVGVHLGGHGFWIQEYMSSKERMGVMRYSGGYKSTSYLRGEGGLGVGA